jgi:hypothetical protein
LYGLGEKLFERRKEEKVVLATPSKCALNILTVKIVLKSLSTAGLPDFS